MRVAGERDQVLPHPETQPWGGRVSLEICVDVTSENLGDMRLRKVFHGFDADGDGRLNQQETVLSGGDSKSFIYGRSAFKLKSRS